MKTADEYAALAERALNRAYGDAGETEKAQAYYLGEAHTYAILAVAAALVRGLA
jgi:hypothetical protein